MKFVVFDYLNYKLYLKDKIQSMPSKGRGVRLSLSRHLGCQTAYISQVLNQHVNLSLEQSVKVSDYFKLNKEESRFFLLLVQYQRAGSKDLEHFLKAEIDEILIKREDLTKRLNVKDRLDEVNEHIYYSVWYYAAIHIILSIPEFQKPQVIAQHLKIPLKKVQEVIKFLCEHGLAVEVNDRYEIGKTRVSLGAGSVQSARHHHNWRAQAINAIDLRNKENLHYSGVFSIASADIPKVKNIVMKSIEDALSIVAPSKEEELQVLNIDWFKV